MVPMVRGAGVQDGFSSELYQVSQSTVCPHSGHRPSKGSIDVTGWKAMNLCRNPIGLIRSRKLFRFCWICRLIPADNDRGEAMSSCAWMSGFRGVP